MSKIKPSHIRVSLSFIFLSLIAVLFQNCGQAGDIQLTTAELPAAISKELNTANEVASVAQEEPAMPVAPGVPKSPLPPSVAPPSAAPALPPSSAPPVYLPPSNIFKVNVTNYKNYVCEPFNTGSQTTSGVNGLKASLAFVSPASSSDESFARELGAKDYWTNSSSLINKSSTPLFFNQINVAPKAFDAGFSIGDGKFLVDLQGDKLIEWFSVRYETLLGLSADDKEGYYKLSTVSDDGVRIDALVDGAWQEVLSNDGIHAPKFQCQKQNSYVLLKKDSKVKLRIYYYQGPRVIISNVLFFKYVGSSIPKNSSIAGCEYNGSEDIYSSPANGSNGQPLDKYNKLKGFGWKEIPTQNFFLSDGEVNPCATNNLVMVSSSDPAFSIIGDRFVNEGQLSFSFLTSVESEAIVKLFEDSPGMAPTLIDQSIRSSQVNSDGKHLHSVSLRNLVMRKSYRMEIIYRNTQLNVSNRVEYLINPAP